LATGQGIQHQFGGRLLSTPPRRSAGLSREPSLAKLALNLKALCVIFA
jgi:hypothetical protein